MTVADEDARVRGRDSGSAGGRGSSGGLRPSNREKEPYITAITIAMADGRLDHEEHARRVAEAETAISFAQLDALVTDIPFEWHDEELAKARRRSRRSFLLGAAGVVALGGLSWWGTRMWIDAEAARAVPNPPATEVGAGNGAGAPETSPPTASSERVATSMVQVTNWQPDTMKTAIEYAQSVGIVAVETVSAWSGDYFDVVGATKDKKSLTVSFRTGYAPEVTEGDTKVTPGTELIPAGRLTGIDLQKLLAEAQKASNLGDDLEQINLHIRHWPNLWTIEIRGSASDTEVYWRIDGKRRWDPDREWDATS